ncbi:MAG TPA: Hsp70 family protein [Bryobacteraceae bacterium]|nr:Hsp70 family protein [Bryobacteraceae bacterium]
MKLGIDFGTTRIVAAAVDRGNYPVITFEDAEGAARDWFPPVIAARGDERRYGWDAWAVQSEPGWTLIRSIKRSLEDAGPYTRVEVGGSFVPMLQLLQEMTAALKRSLLDRSSLPGRDEEPLEIVLGVPANANSNQRFLTVEPFRRAGFQVVGLLNEPSAASIEYGHRNRAQDRDELVLVYDLGGGTFDASLVQIDGRTHSVVASEGVTTVGGDDFDIALAELALEEAGLQADQLTQGELFELHEECRNRKESLHPNTRRIVVDLGVVREGWSEVAIPAPTYYERCRPLIERTIEATENLIRSYDEGARVDALYVTGGGSELPMVARMLKEVFGRRVRRSAYTRSATAIGLAIQADSDAGFVLQEHFTRHFGVWRESQAGKAVTFDPLFPKGTPLPAPGEAPVTIARRYSPVHNVGHFRYLECSHLTEDGVPTGDITVWDEILFPFDPALQADANLEDVHVEYSIGAQQQQIEERYACNASGGVEVQIGNKSAGYTRTYRLGRWSAKTEPVTPGRKKKTKVESR